MKNPFNWFDETYVISHPVTDRADGMRERLSAVGVYNPIVIWAERCMGLRMNNMRRNSAVEFAVNLSHVKAIGHAMTLHPRSALFVEDDVVFASEAEERLSRAIDQLDRDWDVLYLGGHPREKVERVSYDLVRVGTFSCAEAYALSGHAIEAFFDFWCDRIARPNAMFDFILGEFAAENAAYCVYPTITHQPAGYSYIGEKYDDKTELIRRGWATNV